MMERSRIRFWKVALAVSAGLVGTAPALAHCDGLDGPVVNAARQALTAQDVNLVLIWVQEKDESEIRKAFEKTLAVRKLSEEARDLADMYFFETLVRIHRAGEGAPYTGLKPAGRDLGPAIPAADRAVAEGSSDAVGKLLIEALTHGLHERFQRVAAAKRHVTHSVKAGREFVKAYVDFLHYVERVHEAAVSLAGGPEHHEHAGAGHEPKGCSAGEHGHK
ncbi:MAG TPA: DUF6448 family protein [Phycisphaerae bacterium]|jgi:hypothetical protein|nr:DUF6448 family protein [Phycisphaerae bacterium]HOJ52926.1 DUF6448 family protein [Phycisphaerae bacterium]HOL24662.1 DUF6448 family protein [Phycisphaerae bacterium]HPP19199.1 DUF6448 family protein [Phycisphaerae bacterium]HPU31414.1 DUF6448 family protein [Phycisphaerae bacterium]